MKPVRNGRSRLQEDLGPPVAFLALWHGFVIDGLTIAYRVDEDFVCWNAFANDLMGNGVGAFLRTLEDELEMLLDRHIRRAARRMPDDLDEALTALCLESLNNFLDLRARCWVQRRSVV